MKTIEECLQRSRQLSAVAETLVEGAGRAQCRLLAETWLELSQIAEARAHLREVNEWLADEVGRCQVEG